MKEETFYDYSGRRIGYTTLRGSDLYIYDNYGRMLGRYDGTYTYNYSGRRIGKGKLLVAFIAHNFNLN